MLIIHRAKLFNIEINFEEAAWINVLPEVESLIVDCCTSAIKATGAAKFIKDAEVSVLLCNNDFIQNLNSQYREKDSPTNVLSFPNQELEYGKYYKSMDFMLGDIIMAYEIIRDEAKEQNKTLHDHVAHLAVHGCLHLLGYDHIEEKDAKVMEKLEVQILKDMGIKNPY